MAVRASEAASRAVSSLLSQASWMARVRLLVTVRRGVGWDGGGDVGGGDGGGGDGGGSGGGGSNGRVAAAMVVAATVVAATVVVAMVMAWRRFYSLVKERQKAMVWIRCIPQVHFLGRKTLAC